MHRLSFTPRLLRPAARKLSALAASVGQALGVGSLGSLQIVQLPGAPAVRVELVPSWDDDVIVTGLDPALGMQLSVNAAAKSIVIKLAPPKRAVYGSPGAPPGTAGAAPHVLHFAMPEKVHWATVADIASARLSMA